jgi:SAM-dependent methyltransferase
MIDESVVSTQISPSDQMFLGTIGGREQYFACGRSAMECIQKALLVASIPRDRVRRILDLPCGHGRVLRYLRAAFPGARITACDLLRDGVDFCSSAFGATGVYSCDDPERIPLEPASFDLIWVGSLFTHLDAPLWPRFLAVFRDSLCPGGILVFSTHGRSAHERLVENRVSYGIGSWHRTLLLYHYERTGFGYAKYAGSDSYYGFSLSHPAWVVSRLTALGGFRVLSVSETAWENFQDTFACLREPDCQGDAHRTPLVLYWRHLLADRMSPRLRSALVKLWRWSF